MKIGLALGSGSSRGWSHIGVIKALASEGIEPDIICGTSIGSLVGAAYAANNLDKLEEWVCSLTKYQTASFFELNSSFNGFVNKDKLHRFLNQYVATDKATIESLEKCFATVATDLESGREIWLTKGSVLEAVWSSMSLPGLFPAIRNDNRWLVDGGLVNPVPISVCRSLGADFVIAVNLNGDIVGKHVRKARARTESSSESRNKETNENNKNGKNGVVDKLATLVAGYTSAIFSNKKEKDEPPSLFEAIASSVNITQDRITRSRMAGDPPDILLAPKLSHIELLEFYRAEEAIKEGYHCVERMMPEIRHVLGID